MGSAQHLLAAWRCCISLLPERLQVAYNHSFQWQFKVVTALNKGNSWLVFEVVAITAPCSHMTTIWMLGNWLTIITVAASHGHGIAICELPCQHPKSKVNGEACRTLQITPDPALFLPKSRKCTLYPYSQCPPVVPACPPTGLLAQNVVSEPLLISWFTWNPCYGPSQSSLNDSNRNCQDCQC